MSINRGMDIHTMENYSAIENNEIIPFVATWMGLEMIILSEVSQTNTIWHRLYVESKKWYKWTYLQNINRLTYRENKLMVMKGDSSVAGDKLGIWD